MPRKFLNWTVPPGLEAIAEEFDRFAEMHWGGKQKWVAAMSAILLYLATPPGERVDLGSRLLKARGYGKVEELLWEALERAGSRDKDPFSFYPKESEKPERKPLKIAAKVSNPKHGKPFPEKKS